MRAYRYRVFSYIVLLALGGACTSSTEEGTVTPIDSLMIEIFVDIHLTNARAELGSEWEPISLDSIIALHGFSRQAFEEQLDYYTEQPEAYLVVLSQVMERIGEEARSVSGY